MSVSAATWTLNCCCPFPPKYLTRNCKKLSFLFFRLSRERRAIGQNDGHRSQGKHVVHQRRQAEQALQRGQWKTMEDTNGRREDTRMTEPFTVTSLPILSALM